MKMNYLNVMKKFCEKHGFKMMSYYNEEYCESINEIAMCRVIEKDDVNLICIERNENMVPRVDDNFVSFALCYDDPECGSCDIVDHKIMELS